MIRRRLLRMAAGGETPPISAWINALEETMSNVKLTYDEDDTVYVKFYSDGGEEVVVVVNNVDYPYDVYTALKNEYESFDVNEHVMNLLNAKKDGMSGVPDVRALVDDAEMIEKKLGILADEVHNFTFE